MKPTPRETKEAVEKYLVLKAEKKFTCVFQASKQP